MLVMWYLLMNWNKFVLRRVTKRICSPNKSVGQEMAARMRKHWGTSTWTRGRTINVCVHTTAKQLRFNSHRPHFNFEVVIFEQDCRHLAMTHVIVRFRVRERSDIVSFRGICAVLAWILMPRIMARQSTTNYVYIVFIVPHMLLPQRMDGFD